MVSGDNVDSDLSFVRVILPLLVELYPSEQQKRQKLLFMFNNS